MELGNIIKKRKSVKSYSSKKVDWRKILRALENGRFSPMAGNLYSVRFVLVSDKEKINVMKDAAQQEFIGKADYVIIVVSDRTKVKKMYDYFDKGFGAQQSGAVIQNILLSLTEQGLSSCWVGLFEESIIKREFKIPEEQVVEALITVGYGDKVKKGIDKEKPELDKLMFFDSWGKRYMGEDTQLSNENS